MAVVPCGQSQTTPSIEIAPTAPTATLPAHPLPRQPLYHAPAVVPMPLPLPSLPLSQPHLQDLGGAVAAAAAVAEDVRRIAAREDLDPEVAEALAYGVVRTRRHAVDEARSLFILSFIIPILPLYVATTSDHNVHL